MSKTIIFAVSHSRFGMFFCALSLSSALLSVLAGCGGAVDDTSAFLAGQPSGHLDAARPYQFATSSAAAQSTSSLSVSSDAAVLVLSSHVPVIAPLSTSAKAAPLPGSVIEFVATDANLALDQFAGEVRIAMNTREAELGVALQWLARYYSSNGIRHAYVTVVDVGNGKTLVSRGEADDSAARKHSPYAYASSDSDNTMTPEQVKEVACVGGSASTLEQYFQVMRDYTDATYAMAVGLPVGTPPDQVYQRLHQLHIDESHLPDSVANARSDVRDAFHDQRDAARRECSQR